MKLRLYTLLTLLLLVIVGAYVHVEVGGEYTLAVMQSSYTFPVAAWVMLPAVLVFLTSLAHMSFYTALGALRRRALNRDLKALKKLIGHALLAKKRCQAQALRASGARRGLGPRADPAPG